MWPERDGNQNPGMKPLVAISATLIVLVVIWMGYDLVRSRSCEELLEQSTPNLHASLAFLEAKGEIALGRAQVKALSDGAEKLNAQFKGCCISRQKNYISDDEYEGCLRRAQAYDGKVRDVKKNVEQAEQAIGSRDPGHATQYAERAQEMARIALGAVIAVEPAPPLVTAPPTAAPKTDAAIGGGPRPSGGAETDANDDHVSRHRDVGAPRAHDAARDASVE
jgi:hypothetical protein